MLEESSKHNQIYETFKNLAPFAKSTVDLIIKSLNPREATVPACIHITVTKFSSNVIDSHLSLT